MPLRLFDGIELPATADFHVHLRDGAMMETVTPTIPLGGVDIVYVMPNLIPPITTIEAAKSYKARLQALSPDTTFLMSLYLHPTLTPALITDLATTSTIHGIKSYPAGVTTNSTSGVLSYEPYYPLFTAMQSANLILNLHGELPSSSRSNITVLNAESSFLPTLLSLHHHFPNLRIILEHCTTAEAIEAVKACGPTVAGTITAHHLFLTVDDWAGDSLNFCKPVAKLPSDKVALLKAATSGNPKFFLGTDSAPHPLSAKKGGMSSTECEKCAAGVFTQPYATQLVLEAFERGVEEGVLGQEDVQIEKVEGFLGGFGRRFYGVEPSKRRIRVRAKAEKVARYLNVGAEGKSGKDVVVPFRRGEEVYSIEWIDE